MRATRGSQKRTWIVPTSLPRSCSHRKQPTREKNQREKKHNVDSDSEEKGEESKPKMKGESEKQ